MVCEAAGASVPVVGVEVVALFAVEISVDAGGFGGVDVLRDGVGAVPVAVGVVPEGVEEWREDGGFRGGECAELGGSHGVIMRVTMAAVELFGEGVRMNAAYLFGASAGRGKSRSELEVSTARVEPDGDREKVSCCAEPCGICAAKNCLPVAVS